MLGQFERQFAGMANCGPSLKIAAVSRVGMHVYWSRRYN